MVENTPYASGIGSIMYDIVCSKSYLAFAISIISQCMVNPGQAYWEGLKWVIRYLNGSLKVI